MATPLSIIIPAYNEEDRIARTLKSLVAYAHAHYPLPEIIVVDDGSTDATAEVVRRFQVDHDAHFIHLLPLGHNHGKGYAVRAGMRAAKGQWRLFMDADNSVDISHVRMMLHQAWRGNDIVLGSIEVPGGQAAEKNGLHRRVLSWIGKLPVKLFITGQVRDTQRGFKLFTRQAAELVFRLQTIDRWGFDIEIVAIAQTHHLRLVEVPVRWDNPTGSKVTLKSYFSTLGELAKIISNKVMGIYA